MSEQSKILEKMQDLITEILKSGTASVEQGAMIDALEAQLFKQRSFKKSSVDGCENVGEEVAGLFFTDKFTEAIDKLYEFKITPEDFFGFTSYHYDEEDDPQVEMFTDVYCMEVLKSYEARCNL